jgi:elongation factor P
MILSTDLKAGVIVRLDGELYKVISSEYHVGGGKMGGATHAKLRNLQKGNSLERRFRPNEKLEAVELDRVTMDYIYQDGDDFYFMNPDSFEQVPIPRQTFGGAEKFLKPEMPVPVELFEGRPLNVVFPEAVELRVESTAQPIHGQQDNTLKPAVLENGMEILVPQFIREDETVRIEVETGKYLERVRHDDKRRY